MLAALLHSSEPGRICDVVQIGQEFEVHGNFNWVHVPDGTTPQDTYNVDGSITKFNPTALPGFDKAYVTARTIAYGTIGEQLSMLHEELTTTGTLSNTGPWATHISNVKTTIPKSDPMAVYEWTQAHAAVIANATAPLHPITALAEAQAILNAKPTSGI